MRVNASCATASALADHLASRPEIASVLYPGRADHPQYDLAQRQMSGGGTLIAFELAGGKAAAFAMMNAMRIVAVSNNLGDSKSLATHPGTTTHMRIGAEERARLGISDGAIRLSVGLEDVADLIADIDRALDALPASLRTVAS